MIDQPEVDPSAPRDVTVTPIAPRWAGALAGALATALALSAGHALALVGDGPAPVDAVSSSFVDRTPSWLKDWATTTFGTDAKTVLEVGAYLVIFGVAVVLGSAARRRSASFVVGAFVLALIGTASAVERPGTTAFTVIAPFVGAAIGSIVFVVACDVTVGRWLASRRPRESRAPLGWDRRRFIGTTAAAGVLAAAAGFGARREESARTRRIDVQRRVDLPPSDDGGVVADPLHPTDSFITPNDRFYRIDTALSFPRVDLDSWRLRLGGLVDRPLEFSFDDLLRRPQVERTITLCCVSNEVGGPLVGNAVWQGVLLADLLDEAGVRSEAEQVFSRSLDGWTCGFPIDVALDGRDCLVAIGMNGEPLPIAHGFPARLVVPGLYGYVSATKWLSSIELDTWDKKGYWITRGWSRLGPVKTQSRIDVPRPRQTIAPGEFVIAGTAWAQHTGIARVEVRIDDEPWREATLADDLSDDTWRQWTLPWNASPGDHRITVRATDKSGAVQTETVSSVAPNGATGWHSRLVRVGDSA